jgi:hypothetical protein
MFVLNLTSNVFFIRYPPCYVIFLLMYIEIQTTYSNLYYYYDDGDKSNGGYYYNNNYNDNKYNHIYKSLFRLYII